MNATRTMVYRALFDGECKLIHKSGPQLWHEVREHSPLYEPDEEHRWSVFATEEDVPVVEGVAHDWSVEGGCGGVHIHWDCPLCNVEHYCDDDPHDESPYLWFCDRGAGIVMVWVAGT